MKAPAIPVIKKDYADKFRQNQASRGAGNPGKGADVAPPTVIRHMIGNAGKPETGKK